MCIRDRGGDAAQPLKKIERGPFGFEQGVRITAHAGDDFARLRAAREAKLA